MLDQHLNEKRKKNCIDNVITRVKISEARSTAGEFAVDQVDTRFIHERE